MMIVEREESCAAGYRFEFSNSVRTSRSSSQTQDRLEFHISMCQRRQIFHYMTPGRGARERAGRIL